MAPQPTANEVIRSAYKRAFVQRGGAGPLNSVRYAGQNENFIEVDDVDNPVLGGIERSQVHSPTQYGAYETVATILQPPDFPTNSVMFKERRGSIPWVDYNPTCPFTLYEPVGLCKRPDDLYGGWESYVKILASGRITGRQEQGNTKFSEDVETITQADVTWTGGVYRVGKLGFGEAASVEVAREVIDIAYGQTFDCGDCGPGNDGTKWIYALQQDDGSSTGIVAQVIYSVDGGATWTALPITGIGTNATVSAIDVMGTSLVVLSDSENAYYYADINSLTGVPGAFTKVTSGFVATKLPKDIYVISASEAYIAAQGGYIYRLSAPGAAVTVVLAGTAGVANLARIDGVGETIVAVGATGTILKSTNRGVTWAATTSNGGISATIQAVDVVTPYLYWIGTAAGELWFTVNGGETWAQRSFTGSGTGAIWDILFPTMEVGYVAYATATPTAKLLTTFTGGETFSFSDLSTQARVGNWPTFNKAGRLATPVVGSLGIRSNNLAIAGLAGGGTDGIILIGTAPIR